MSYSEEYVKGWQAAREQYQKTGGVLPYPAGYQPAPGPEVVLNINDMVHETKLRPDQKPRVEDTEVKDE